MLETRQRSLFDASTGHTLKESTGPLPLTVCNQGDEDTTSPEQDFHISFPLPLSVWMTDRTRSSEDCRRHAMSAGSGRHHHRRPA